MPEEEDTTINFIELWEETVGDSGKAPTDEELITFGTASYNTGWNDAIDFFFGHQRKEIE